jgi:hypothetical protein
MMPSDEAVMPFGKHAGELIYSMVCEDMSYVRWLLEQKWLDVEVARQLRAAIAEYRADCAAGG